MSSDAVAAWHNLAARALDPDVLIRVVPHLAPEALHRIVADRGLEASADLVAAATPAQLTALLDIDLWRRQRPGDDDAFDPARFAEWIEALVDASDVLAARTAAAMDPDVVVAALSRYVQVFDPATIAGAPSLDGEVVDIEMPRFTGLTAEIGGYVIRARRSASWDAFIALLVALEEHHRACFDRVMRGCRRLSDSEPELDGLDDLLSAPEQAVHDVSIEREERRATQGYMSSADARAFLQVARTADPDRAVSDVTTNPIAGAFFRDLEALTSAEASATDRPGPVLTASDASDDGAPADAVRQVLELLAGDAPVDGPAALLDAPGRGEPPLASVRALLQRLFERDQLAYLARTEELAFLANALMAGCGLLSRPFTAREAFDAAVATCNLGLERRDSEGEQLPSLVAAFEYGWTILYRDVTLHVTDTLIDLLATRQSADPTLQRDLDMLRKTLEDHRRSGTPWQAGDALDPLAVLDTPAWAGLLGLMSECPVLKAIVWAVATRHTTKVDPREFAFISTAEQIAQIHSFTRRLADLLFPPAAPPARTTS